MKISVLMSWIGLILMALASSWLTGCPPQSGMLQVINDIDPPLVELYITTAAAEDWGSNLLDSPLPKDWLCEIEVEPGLWDIFSLNAESGGRMITGVKVDPHKTQSVYVSSMRDLDAEEGKGAGEETGESSSGALAVTGGEDGYACSIMQ
ncbi:MAG TPA: hypothetical protein PLZ53_07835 [Candidatus Hydrogenedentes bacterium]|nr:MAG: hypothetical protein BWY07_02368 [Candidatus Hydrogenedentes bacterium ADurb.Bin170]HNZ49436.1 hypothetical protein [Candidatus Hydrogenedentota bacterium]HOD96460.1 hypothetical protein [Candidatus Hydrogenedentota bacterium]HOH43014.1 hypothetical protein [Candidatus Hydrogenedentota bacterium]HOM48127.1 hypothetical protein [Candidatus Hydrogenedentota bacterium]